MAGQHVTWHMPCNTCSLSKWKINIPICLTVLIQEVKWFFFFLIWGPNWLKELSSGIIVLTPTNNKYIMINQNDLCSFPWLNILIYFSMSSFLITIPLPNIWMIFKCRLLLYKKCQTYFNTSLAIAASLSHLVVF